MSSTATAPMFSSRRFSFVVPGNRSDPRLLREQPGERDLRGSRFLLLRDAAEQVNQRLVRLESLGRKARKSAAEVGAVEFRALFDRSRQESLAQRAIRHETDPEFLERRNHFLLRAFSTTANIRSAER